MGMPRAKANLRPAVYLTVASGSTPAWAAGTVIPWDTQLPASAAPDIVPSLAGGTIGQITLMPGSYWLECKLGSNGTSQYEEWQWYNVTAAAAIGISGRGAHLLNTTWNLTGLNPFAVALLKITAITVVEVKVTVASGTIPLPQNINTTLSSASIVRLE